MTTTANDTVERSTISGVGPYPFSFRVFDESELTVTAIVSGAPTALALTTNYTVSGVDVAAGGSITLVSATATAYAGATLDVRSNTVLDQPTSFRNQGTFLASSHEDAFDRLSRQIQDLNRKFMSTLRLPEYLNTNGEISPLANWLNRYLYVNTSGQIEPAAAITTTALTQALIGGLLYPQTTAEVSAGVVPTNYAIPSHDYGGHIYPERYGTIDANGFDSGGIECSAVVYLAQKVQRQCHAPIFFQGRTYVCSIDVHYSGCTILGAGPYSTILKMPIWTVAVVSTTVVSNVHTVVCAGPHHMWVDRSVKVYGTTDSTHNQTFLVLSILSPTSFTCQQLSIPNANGSSTGGFISPANGIDFGELMNGNSATAAYHGSTLWGICFDGQRSLRVAPTNDLSDWGIGLTQYSDWHHSNVRAIHWWHGGHGHFILSNNGYCNVQVEDCGFGPTIQPPGVDNNACKNILYDCTSIDCNYGFRVLSNMDNLTGTVRVKNATVTGAIFGVSALNNGHNCNFTVTVFGGCIVGGVQIGGPMQSGQFRIVVDDVSGDAVQEVYNADPLFIPLGNSYNVTTSRCGGTSAIIGGNDGHWIINSNEDCQTNSPYSVIVRGQRNTYSVGLRGQEISASVTAATKANPAAITTSGAHLLITGDNVIFASVGGMTQLNSGVYSVTVTSATTFTLDGINSTGFGTYTSGGTVSKQTKGLSLEATSGGNLLTSYMRNAYATGYTDAGAVSGSPNRFLPRTLFGSKTYDCPSLTGIGTPATAQTSTTVTVTGARVGVGDLALARHSVNTGGLIMHAEVTADDLVTVWVTNLTNGTVDPIPGTLFVDVTKGVP
jgi:hypothetical protein